MLILLTFDTAMKVMTGISEVWEYFVFYIIKKIFVCDFCGGGGVYDRGLSSDKQPVTAACKGASKSFLMKKSMAGKQVKNSKHLLPLTLGNGVCVSETTAWSAA